MKSDPATPLPREDQAAFDAALVQLNLRHAQWFVIAIVGFLASVWIFRIFRSLPLGAETAFLDGLIGASGLLSLACIAWFRRRPVASIWPRVLILADVVLMLAATNIYFFVVLPAYGITSVYIIGVLMAAVFFYFPPRVLGSLLLANHAVFLLLFLRQPLPPHQLASTAIDFSGVVILAAVAGWLLYRGHQDNFHKERVIVERTHELARLRQLEIDEKLAARLGEEKARLEVLRYQLNPHFLYNALNSIRSLVSSAPAAAGGMVTQLADFCRLTLTRPDHPGPVTEEFAMLRLYLEMERTRWRDSFAVEFELAPDAAVQLIPPFLLLPLVENALKHGAQSSPDLLRLRLTARLDGDALVLEVANTGAWLAPGDSLAPSTGVGLDNLRRRLERYFPGTHTLTIAADGGWVTVRVTIAGRRGFPAAPV